MKKTDVIQRTAILLIIVLALYASVAQAGPDLELALENLYKYDYGPTELIQVRYHLTNVGDEKPSEVVVRLYVSADTTITADDFELGSSWVSRPSPGITSIDTVGGRIERGDLPPGSHYIGAIVYCDTDLDDLSNNVNCTSEMFSLPVVPDLSVIRVRAHTGFYRPGDTIRVYDGAIENNGYGPSESYTVDFYASSDKDIDPFDYHIGSKTYSPLAVGDKRNFEKTCRFPDDMPDDDYYIGVIVTCPKDFDPGNNKAVDSDSVWVGSMADLAVQSVQITADAYGPGDQLAIYSLVENIGGRRSKSYTVDYYASEDSTIAEDDHHLGGVKRTYLAADKKDSYETSFRIPFSMRAGHYYVGVVVTSREEDNTANNVGRSDNTIELVHPSGYVCGNAQYVYSSKPYQFYSDWVFPIRYALVQVFEDDGNGDSLDDVLVWQTFTDPNGNYSLILPSDEDRPGDIYVKILTEGVSGAYPGSDSSLCSLRDDVFGETYSLVSPVHAHPQEASVVINMTAPDSGEFVVFDSIVEGFIQANALFEIEPNEPNEVMAYWPSEDGFSYFDPCDQGLYVAQGDRCDRDVIMHEYGHYVAEICGVGLGPVGDNAVHYWDEDLRDEPVWRTEEHAMNLAFREAWASVFSIATQYGDIQYPYAGDSKYTDVEENASWTLEVDLDNEGTWRYSPGQYFENMNAGALWDIFVTLDREAGPGDGSDVPGHVPLSMIWAVSRNHRPDSILDFWNSWFLEYDYEAEMTSIFEGHEMRFVRPGP